jgi:hypothetical protein
VDVMPPLGGPFDWHMPIEQAKDSEHSFEQTIMSLYVNVPANTFLEHHTDNGPRQQQRHPQSSSRIDDLSHSMAYGGDGPFTTQT